MEDEGREVFDNLSFVRVKFHFPNEDMMMRRTLYSMILVLAFAFFPNHLRAQDAQDRFKTDLEPLIEQVVEQRKIPGFAIAIVHNQKVVYAAGFGVRNLENKNDKITTRSLCIIFGKTCDTARECC